jgi:hypothetical protein
MDPDKNQPKDWRELCNAAACELDPKRLMELIGELTRALEERDRRPNGAADSLDRNELGDFQRQPAPSGSPAITASR